MTVTTSGGTLVLAHRGDWLEGQPAAPQNSVQAVLGALEAGADGVEVDVRLTADGAVVLHHDPDLGPADLEAGCREPVGRPIRTLASNELGHLSTLGDLLEALAAWPSRVSCAPLEGPLVLDIELKDLPGEPGWDRRRHLAQVVGETLTENGVTWWSPRSRPGSEGPRARPLQVIVSSFDPGALVALAQAAPGATTALLVEAGDDWRTRVRHLGPPAGLAALNPPERLARPGLFAEAAARDLAVMPWTVDHPQRAAELAALGAAAVITNRPRAVMAALKRHAS